MTARLKCSTAGYWVLFVDGHSTLYRQQGGDDEWQGGELFIAAQLDSYEASLRTPPTWSVAPSTRSKKTSTSELAHNTNNPQPSTHPKKTSSDENHTTPTSQQPIPVASCAWSLNLNSVWKDNNLDNLECEISHFFSVSAWRRKEQINANKRCHIREIFKPLYQAGGRWCKWGELIGGFGDFSVHPSCLTRTMYGLLIPSWLHWSNIRLEKHLTVNDLEEIAGHLRTRSPITS